MKLQESFGVGVAVAGVGHEERKGLASTLGRGWRGGGERSEQEERLGSLHACCLWNDHG